jgi:peptidoglycan/LPS O-acetylase OafA/YrhL
VSSLLVQTIFGWPAIILSLAVSVIGILKRWPWMLVLGGVLCAPFTVYLFGFTYLHFFAFILPFFQFGAAWAVRARRKILPWIFLLPLASIMVILAIIVLSQFG